VTDPNDSLPLDNQFSKATPVLRVRSVEASADYYVRVLGFRVDFRDPGIIASVSRGECTLFLVEGDQGYPGAWVFIGVEDAGALWQEYQHAGARLRQPPTNHPWAREIQIEDLDGNVLRFGSEPIEGEPYGEWLDMRGERWRKVNGGWERS
jgi:catechol 2,3-dioxygenase-like lactoylglutathione lyase family enzyme